MYLVRICPDYSGIHVSYKLYISVYIQLTLSGHADSEVCSQAGDPRPKRNVWKTTGQCLCMYTSYSCVYMYTYQNCLHMYLHVYNMYVYIHMCIHLQIVAFPTSYGKNPFAYSFKQSYPSDGWKVYDPQKEMARLVSFICTCSTCTYMYTCTCAACTM